MAEFGWSGDRRCVTLHGPSQIGGFVVSTPRLALRSLLVTRVIAVATLLVPLVILAPPATRARAATSSAALATMTDADYVAELQRRFGPIDASDEELRILLASPGGDVYQTLVDGAAVGERLYSGEDELQIAMLQLYGGLLEWAGGLLVDGGLGMLQSAALQFGARGLTAAIAIEAYGTYDTFRELAGKPALVKQFEDVRLGAEHREILKLYSAERLNGSDEETAWADSGGLYEDIGEDGGILADLAEHFEVAVSDYPAVVERHYQLVRLSIDYEKVQTIRLALDGTVQMLRAYRSTKNEFMHLLAGSRRLQVLNAGPQDLRVTYLVGDTVVGFAELSANENSEVALVTDWSNVTDVLLEVDEIGSWKSPFSDHSVSSYADPIEVTGNDGIDRTFLVRRVLRSHNGTPPSTSIAWKFGGPPEATTQPAEPVTRTFSCPGTYGVSAKATSGSLPAIDLATTVTVSDPWRAVIETDPPGIVMPDAPVTFSVGGDVPPGIGYAWNFGNGATSTSPTAVTSYPTKGSRTVTLTLTDPATNCVRYLSKIVMVDVVTQYLPTTINTAVTLQPGLVYLTASNGTQVTSRGSLTIPAGTVLKGDGGLFAAGGRVEVNGTATSPVAMTSARDSTIGGTTSCSCPTDGWVIEAYSGGTVVGSHVEIRNALVRGNGGAFTLTDAKVVRSTVDVTSTSGLVGWTSTRLQLDDDSDVSLKGWSHRLTDTVSTGTRTPLSIDSQTAVIDGLSAPSAATAVWMTATAAAGASLRRLSGAAGAVIAVSQGTFPKRAAVLANTDLPYRFTSSSYGWHVVPDGGRLQLLPGVRLQAANSLSMLGTLDVVGTADRPVRITVFGSSQPMISLGTTGSPDELVLEHASLTSVPVTATSDAHMTMTDSTLISSPVTTSPGVVLSTARLQMQGAGMTLRGGTQTLVDTTITQTSYGLDLGSGAVAAVEGLTASGVTRPVVMSPSSSASTFTRLSGDPGAALFVSVGTYPARVTTWTATDWPYRLSTASSGSHLLPAGATLNLAPGVRVLGENAALVLNGGSLVLGGTAQSPVTVAPAGGAGTSWAGITLASGALGGSFANLTGGRLDLSAGSSATLSDSNLDGVPVTFDAGGTPLSGLRLTRVNVRHAGISLRGGTHDLRDILLADTASAGLSLDLGANAAVDGLTVAQSSVNVTPSASGSRFTRLTGPANSAIFVSPGTFRSGTTEWAATDWPYVMPGSTFTNYVIPAGATLKLGPGVRAQSQGLVAVNGGRLELAGERDHPASLGPNGSGWPGVQVSTPGSVRGALSANYAVVTGRVELQNADADLARTKISTLDVRNSSRATLRYSSIQSALTADSTSSADAIQNWWGAPSGPRPTGTGASVSGPVTFDPWCHVEDCSDYDPDSDNDPPDIVGTADRAPNDAGWYDAPVTVTWTATDGGHALPAPPAVVATDEGANQTLTSAEVCDAVGNCAVGTYVVSVDLTKPTIRTAAVPEPNGAGWNRTVVEVSYLCDDEISGVIDCPAPVTVTDEGRTTLVGGTRDAAGHTATVEREVRVDHTAPEMTVSGPHDGDTVPASTFVPPTCDGTDALSGLAAECAVTTTATPEAPGRLVYQASAAVRDLAGNETSREWSFTVITDEDGPSIEAITDRDPNVNGWYSAPVTVQFSCSDASGLATCPEPVVFDHEGANQSARVRAVDVNGNESYYTVAGMNLDFVAPEVTFSGSDQYTVADEVRIICTAEDPLSGLWTASCPTVIAPALDFGVGSHTITATATDLAGNTTTVLHTFTVIATTSSVATIVDAFAGADSGAARSMRSTLSAGDLAAFRRQIDAFCCTEDARRGTSRPLTRAEAATLRALADALEAASQT